MFVDEISFADQNFINSMDEALRTLTQKRDKTFGGLPVVFVGDFFQLPPVGSNDLLYLDDTPGSWFHSINSFVKLHGGHCFKDQVYRQLLERLRLGKMTNADIRLINS